MEDIILVRSEGSGNAELLEKKVLELNEEFSKEGVKVYREIKKSLEFGAVEVGTLLITIGTSVASGLILKIIDKIFSKKEDVKNVNIHINIKKLNVIFNLPKDMQKLLDYCKENEKKQLEEKN